MVADRFRSPPSTTRPRPIGLPRKQSLPRRGCVGLRSGRGPVASGTAMGAHGGSCQAGCCRPAITFEMDPTLAHQQEQQGITDSGDLRSLRCLRVPRAWRRKYESWKLPPGNRADRADVPASVGHRLGPSGGIADRHPRSDRLLWCWWAWPRRTRILIVEFARQRQDVEGRSPRGGRDPPPHGRVFVRS